MLSAAGSVAIALVAVLLTAFATAPAGARDPQSLPKEEDFDYGTLTQPTLDGAPEGLPVLERADLSTLRLLAQDDVTDYWSVQREGTLCILLVVDEFEASAASCATPEEFTSEGVGVRLLTPGTAGEAYLLPDSVAKEVGSSVIIVDPFGSETAGLKITNGGFALNQLPAVTPDEIPNGLLELLGVKP
jgi:hypothetical protein